MFSLFKKILSKNSGNGHIVFFGTPEFSATILKELLEKKFSVAGVVTRADKPVGRKHVLTASPVKQLAAEYGIPVLQPKRLDANFLEEVRKLNPDIIITAAYGKIFPPSVLSLPPLGCLNVHASLLPLYRGASPIQEALRNGDQTTGVSLMRMDEGLDTGPVYAKHILPLEPHELFPQVSEHLAKTAATFVADTLPLILKGTLEPAPQEEDRATLCQLIEKEDGHIYWSNTASEIFNLYRAFFVWPGIFTFWKRNDAFLRLKLTRIRLRADILSSSPELGQVFLKESGIFVTTAEGSIELLEVQLEGKKPLEIRDFIRGYDDFIGCVLQ